jgi:hypothetical protein
MKLVRTIVVAASACTLSGCWIFEEDCAHTYYGGGEATVTMLADGVESSWTVSGLEKKDLDLIEAAVEARDGVSSTIYPPLVSRDAGAVVSAFADREARDSWVVAFVAAPEVSGLECFSEPIAGFVVKGQLTPSSRPSVANEVVFFRGVDDAIAATSSDEEEGEAVMDFVDETSGTMSLNGSLQAPDSTCEGTTVDVTLAWDLDAKADRFHNGSVCYDWQFWPGF